MKKVMVAVGLVCVCSLVFLGSGCASKKAADETVVETSTCDGTVAVESSQEELMQEETLMPTTYKVKKGDTLWKISESVYGHGKDWKKIYNANSATIGDPDNLKAGMSLIIPN